MPRPIWTGSISFGLVNIPIKLVSAIESHRVAFHEFEEGTGHRIRNKRVAEVSGKEVPWDHIQKGFEVSKDNFVVLTEDELAAAAPERTHAIEIEHFVPLAEIDPASFDQAYFALPDGPAADKAYVLLRDAMRGAERVAVGRFVMRTKAYVACIRPLGQALALQTLYFADEVRRIDDVVKLPARSKASARELEMAKTLLKTLEAPWRPEAYEDTFRASVLALVKKKERGETIDTSGAKPAGPRIVDLMEALKATLERGKPNGKREAPRRAAKPRTRAPARSGARHQHGGHA